MNRKLTAVSYRLPVMAMLFVVACGCGSSSRYSTEAAATQPSYWIDQPASARASGDNFDRLWAACEDVARDHLFRLDRTDFRTGVLTTQPMVSSQWFEPWRRDAVTIVDRNESTVATIRRTIQFEFERISPDQWQVSPKVLVERQALAEQRITSTALYRNFYTYARNPAARPSGTRESDQGVYLPSRYWYPIGRDADFERVLASEVQKKMRS